MISNNIMDTNLVLQIIPFKLHHGMIIWVTLRRKKTISLSVTIKINGTHFAFLINGK